MYSDWSVLAELLLGFVHLSDEVDEALSGFWHPLLWPVSELELADCSGLAVLGDEEEKVFSYNHQWLIGWFGVGRGGGEGSGCVCGGGSGGGGRSKDCMFIEEATRLLSHRPSFP